MSDYPEQLIEMGILFADGFVQQGFNDEQAITASCKMLEYIRTNMGGSLLYIHKGSKYESDEMKEEIWKKFNGRNHEALRREYGTSIQHIYRILKTARDKTFAKHQQNLI
jgi:Mor family transcriptional regulator